MGETCFHLAIMCKLKNALIRKNAEIPNKDD